MCIFIDFNNSTEKNYLPTHETDKGTKMAGSFADIFTAGIDCDHCGLKQASFSQEIQHYLAMTH